MKIAVCQMAAKLTGRDARMAAIGACVRHAAADGARIVVCPELATTGYGAGDELNGHAERPDGRTVAALTALSASADIAIVAGLPLIDGDEMRNAAVFVAPDGRVVCYSKIHLYGAYEKDIFAPGREPPPILDFEGMAVGLLVCFDVEFPERTRDLALRGAAAILVPTALPASAGGRFIAQSVVPVRAFENQVFIAYANHAGRDNRFAYQGLSCIAAPDGRLLAQAPEDAAAMIIADLDPAAYQACRDQNPYLEEIRTAGPDGL